MSDQSNTTPAERMAQREVEAIEGIDFFSKDYDVGQDCGRWINGRLGRRCTLAGTEFCDWECPYAR